MHPVYNPTRKIGPMVKLDHVMLSVRDWRASRDWYRKHFGLKIEFEVPDGGESKLGVAAIRDDSGLTLFLEQGRNPPAACDCVHYFQIDRVDEAYRMLSATGVKFRHGPKKVFWGYGAELIDPDGHVIRIWDENQCISMRMHHPLKQAHLDVQPTPGLLVRVCIVRPFRLRDMVE
jgi:catechol 2,3-dioxygenase-like lactoylglutathione lyase family enzyme